MDQVTDDLWISDAPTVRELSEPHQFEHVVTVGYFDRLGYNRPTASDTGDRFVFQDAAAHEYDRFAAAVDHLRETLSTPTLCPVLVHCQAGVSRSAAVCTAALAVQAGLSYETAFETVATARSKVDPIPPLVDSARRYIQQHEKSDEATGEY